MKMIGGVLFPFGTFYHLLIEGVRYPRGRPYVRECTEPDKKIEHYKALRSRITDRIALDGLAELIAKLLAEKAKLHPKTNE